MNFADLPLEIISEIAGESRQVYHTLVLAYPAFARNLTLGDRLDFAEKFGYDCRVGRKYDEWRTVWYLNGSLHRIGGPAIEYADGVKCWFINNRLHRIDGPAIEWAGGEEWHIDGKRHRIDGPAIECRNDSNYWYLDNKLHRIDGPAVERSDGTREWYINGIQMSEVKFVSAVSKLSV